MIVHFDCEFCGFENSQEVEILDDEMQAGDGLEVEFECESCNAVNEYVLALLKRDFVDEVNVILKGVKNGN